MKLLIETTGSFMLMCPVNGDIPYNRPSVQKASQVINRGAAANQVRILCNSLSDEATDADFADALKECKGNTDLAIDAFVAEFQAADVKDEGPKDEGPKDEGPKDEGSKDEGPEDTPPPAKNPSPKAGKGKG